ncbi:MAG: radical SAM protein [Patescibacteria group bacterium]
MKGFTREELLLLAWEKPILAQLEITDRCNQHCPFCQTGKQGGTGASDMTLDQWLTIIPKLKNIGVRRLDYTGRESFTSPYFTELLAYCREEDFEIKVNTNGTFAVSGVLPFVDEIIFSVHGLHQVHDHVVGNVGSFAELEVNVERTVRAGKKASINMLLIKANYHQLLDVFAYFNEKYGIWKFAPSLPIPSLYGSEFSDVALTVNRELLMGYMASLRAIPQDKLVLKHGFHSIFLSEPKHYQDNGLLLPNCAAGKYKLVIDNDGSVYPCNYFKGDQFYCGNILTGDEHDIWKNGKGFQQFRQLVLDEQIPTECHGCLKKSRCFSGCRAWSTVYQEGGFANAKDQRCELGSAFVGSGINHEM